MNFLSAMNTTKNEEEVKQQIRISLYIFTNGIIFINSYVNY